MRREPPRNHPDPAETMKPSEPANPSETPTRARDAAAAAPEGEAREQTSGLRVLSSAGPSGRLDPGREFPPGASEPPTGLTRRNMLALMGASAALAGFAGCRRPEEAIVPYVQAPEQVVPGVASRYASTFPLGTDAYGVVVESHEGRPTKIEGNRLHPASLGAASSWMQASVLELWDPDRSRRPLRRAAAAEAAAGDETEAAAAEPDRLGPAEAATWEEFGIAWNELAGVLETAGGEGLAVVSCGWSSPTVSRLVSDFRRRFPRARWVVHEPAGDGNVFEGLRLATGRPARPLYDLSRARRILSLDADFLLTGSQAVRNARDFAAGRRVDAAPTPGEPLPRAAIVAGLEADGETPAAADAGGASGTTSAADAPAASPPAAAPGASETPGEPNRLYVVESAMTVTGANADHRVPLARRRIPAFARALARRLGVEGAFEGAPVEGFGEDDPLEGLDDGVLARLETIAEDLEAHAGEAVVLAGREQPPEIHALVHALNERLAGGAVRTVELEDAGWGLEADLLELVAAMRGGEVSTLIVLGANPAYTTPGHLDFAGAMGAVDTVVHLGPRRDETARHAHWHLPESHYLESWGDARSADGTLSPIQPVIAPLYHSRSLPETLHLLATGGLATGYDLVRAVWGVGSNGDGRWERALHDGVAPAGIVTGGPEGELVPVTRVGVPEEAAEAGEAAAGAGADEAAGTGSGQPADGAAPGAAEGAGAAASQPADGAASGAAEGAGAPARGAAGESATPGATAAAVPSGDPALPPATQPAEPRTGGEETTFTPGAEGLDVGTPAESPPAVEEAADEGDVDDRERSVPTASQPSAAISEGAGGAITDLEGELDLELYVSPALHDGRFANNAWLQELPDPITRLTWDNAACVSPATARTLGVETGEIVRLEAGEIAIDAPVWVAPGQSENTVALALGYGRRSAGRVGSGVGADPYRLRRIEAPWAFRGLSLVSTGRRRELATTQEHWEIEPGARAERMDRIDELARSAPLETYREHPEFAQEVHGPPLESLWEEPELAGTHQWGMTIDLNACTGCNACVAACQAENNVPVVGREQVIEHREMHWLRVDRYFDGDEADPAARFQPIPCQHCENAPCEQVCPVAATVHDAEGLNVMVYNRCIGTRYCSNNCPYKVRRFNFFNYTKATPLSMQNAMNPDVSVRSRGVMEKCTFCLQRIQEAKIAAVRGGREVRDGDVETACQQTCPTQAIVFGDLTDPESRVVAEKGKPRSYILLAEMNNKPRNSYLARVTNPNPRWEAGA